MSKLEETEEIINYIGKAHEAGFTADNSIMLLDIARSLAMIADRLCKEESEE